MSFRFIHVVPNGDLIMTHFFSLNFKGSLAFYMFLIRINIGLAKKFIQIFLQPIWKNLNEILGHSILLILWVEKPLDALMLSAVLFSERRNPQR